MSEKFPVWPFSGPSVPLVFPEKPPEVTFQYKYGPIGENILPAEYQSDAFEPLKVMSDRVDKVLKYLRWKGWTDLHVEWGDVDDPRDRFMLYIKGTPPPVMADAPEVKVP